MVDNYIIALMKKNTADLDNIIGRNLKRLRKSKEWSQEVLANKLQVAKQKVSGYENGRVGIGKDVMARLCNIFKVDYYEFYVDDTTPLPESELEYKALMMARLAERTDNSRVCEELIDYEVTKIKNTTEGLKVFKELGKAISAADKKKS